jgi:hypothetical protein
MAWAFRETAETVPTSGAGTTSITISMPTGTAENDLLVAVVSINHDQTTSGVTESGSTWTEIRTLQTSSANTLSFWYKIAGASEGSVTFNWSDFTDGHSGSVTAYTGIDTADPLDVSAENSGGNATTLTAPTVTTTNDNALVVRACSQDHSGGTNCNFSSDETLRGEGTGRFDTNIGAGYGIADSNQATAGATGTSAFTSDISEQWCTVTAAFNEALAEGGEGFHSSDIIVPRIVAVSY